MWSLIIIVVGFGESPAVAVHTAGGFHDLDACQAAAEAIAHRQYGQVSVQGKCVKMASTP
jgi:hypothetical protein